MRPVNNTRLPNSRCIPKGREMAKFQVPPYGMHDVWTYQRIPGLRTFDNVTMCQGS